MPRAIDLTGQTFSHLRVIERVANRNRAAVWLCECVCDKRLPVAGYYLRHGRTRSCGCKSQAWRGAPDPRFSPMLGTIECRTCRRSHHWAIACPVCCGRVRVAA